MKDKLDDGRVPSKGAKTSGVAPSHFKPPCIPFDAVMKRPSIHLRKYFLSLTTVSLIVFDDYCVASFYVKSWTFLINRSLTHV